MGAHKLYPAYLNRQMGCVPSHGKNPGRSVHGRTATTLAGLKLRRDKLLRYAPCPLWGNVVALFFSPGEYLGAIVFENIFFPPLASRNFSFHKPFCLSKYHTWVGLPHSKVFEKLLFLKTFSQTFLKRAPQSIVRLFFEKRRQE